MHSVEQTIFGFADLLVNVSRCDWIRNAMLEENVKPQYPAKTKASVATKGLFREPPLMKAYVKFSIIVVEHFVVIVFL